MKALERLSVSFIVGALVLGRVMAQEHPQTTAGGIPLAEIPAPPPLDMQELSQADAPEIGNWASVALEIPIFPFNPYSGLTNVPVYLLRPADRKGGLPFMAFDDRAIETVRALERAALEAEQEQEAKSGNRSLKTSGKGEGSEPVVLAKGLVPLPDDLLVDIEEVIIASNLVSVVILPPTSWTNIPPLDLYATTNLSLETPEGALNATNWTFLARSSPNQTNLLVPMLSDTECYLRLADTNDLDGDGLTDAFERLVSHSNGQTNDSDGDGLLDAWAWTHFGSVYALAANNTGPTRPYGLTKSQSGCLIAVVNVGCPRVRTEPQG